MATIRFYPKKERSGRYSIVCMMSHGTGKEQPKSIGYMIDNNTKQWNKALQQAKACDNATDINAKISGWKSKFAEYVGRVKRDEIDFDFDEAYSYISSGKVTKRKASLVSNITAGFVAYQMKTFGDKNAVNYEITFNDLVEYEKFINYQHKLSEIDPEFYLEFGLYLAEVKNNINSTINRKIGRIRTLLEWAFTSGMIDTQRYAKTFNFKTHESGRFPLTEAEINMLACFQPELSFQKLILNAFLFACETGLRVSDLQQLQPHHIKTFQDQDGEISYLDLTQVKGSVRNFIPLSNRALQLLGSHPDENIFAFKYSQSANVALKKSAKTAGLTRKVEIVFNQGNAIHKIVESLHDIISFHFARNTYISLLLAKGLQPVFVRDNVGHAELSTTMIYSKQDDIIRWKETLKIQNK